MSQRLSWNSPGAGHIQGEGSGSPCAGDISIGGGGGSAPGRAGLRPPPQTLAQHSRHKHVGARPAGLSHASGPGSVVGWALGPAPGGAQKCLLDVWPPLPSPHPHVHLHLPWCQAESPSGWAGGGLTAQLPDADPPGLRTCHAPVPDCPSPRGLTGGRQAFLLGPAGTPASGRSPDQARGAGSGVTLSPRGAPASAQGRADLPVRGGSQTRPTGWLFPEVVWLGGGLGLGWTCQDPTWGSGQEGAKGAGAPGSAVA